MTVIKNSIHGNVLEEVNNYTWCASDQLADSIIIYWLHYFPSDFGRVLKRSEVRLNYLQKKNACDSLIIDAFI